MFFGPTNFLFRFGDGRDSMFSGALRTRTERICVPVSAYLNHRDIVELTFLLQAFPGLLFKINNILREGV